ncbi:glucosaminidase domain-containing protein [Celerinatantimonas sp. MCCC 1A17872]|uniref:glucosaminidase domain-containing protein n=1 Tax=Celerinatantimonas sp. MCCC 1A17872 TaxID=3177514 RepID=UPI0038C891F4
MRWLFYITALLMLMILQGCDYRSSGNVWAMPSLSLPSTSLPKLTKDQAPTAKKKQFTEYLLPMVKKMNSVILKKRELLKKAYAQYREEGALSRSAKYFVKRLAREYKVPIDDEDSLSDNVFNQLLRRVDVIPPNLVLAQAANESAWGTSRFARQGNNLFGQWCYTQGCGIVPSARADDATHEVKKFTTPAKSVVAYMRNLNTNPAYSEFRDIRYQLRQQGKKISGRAVVKGLVNYSARGMDYVDSLTSLMKTYKNRWPDSPQTELN